jgi:SAM-dependent methyltransferase
MGFYSRFILPRILHWACGHPSVTKERQAMLKDASGSILEVGVGSGRNFPHYNSKQVTHVCGIDPDPGMLALAKAGGPTSFPLELIEGSGEALPMKEGSQDTLVVAFTLCSVANPMQMLDECCRVLRPGGKLLFAEHGLSPESPVASWQHRLNPIWKALAGGCHLNRDPIPLLTEAGFQMNEAHCHYMKGVPRFAGYVTRGLAVRPIRVPVATPQNSIQSVEQETSSGDGSGGGVTSVMD